MVQESGTKNVQWIIRVWGFCRAIFLRNGRGSCMGRGLPIRDVSMHERKWVPGAVGKMVGQMREFGIRY